LSVRAPSAKHSSRDFEAELRALRAHILAMGARCERIVGLAFDAFLQGTPDAAREVFGLDAHIDRDDLAIHALIMRMLGPSPARGRRSALSDDRIAPRHRP
jgi:phosphate uptake regulator